MLKTGKYYIGDPCYVLDEHSGFDWSKLLDETGFFGLFVNDGKTHRDTEDQNGEFVLRDQRIFVSATAHGDGVYYDREGREYGVDAGLLAAVPAELVPNNPGLKNGHVLGFSKNFRCHYDNGKIFFGNVVINTEFEQDA